jgi:hypothetical protein
MINLKCLFGHKWNYYQESEEKVGTFGSSSGGAGSAGPVPASYVKKYKIVSDFRICESCYRKQEKVDLTSTVYGTKSKGWSDVSLNKKEIRDKKLEQIGI